MAPILYRLTPHPTRAEKKTQASNLIGCSGEDGREVNVQLTARGERILGKLTRHTRAELRSAAPALVTILRKLTGTRKRPNRARG
jgi:hypothetical protein